MLAPNWLNVARVIICIAILAYSCITDWKIRRASNRLWYVMGGIGLVLGLLELATYQYTSGYDTRMVFSWIFGFVFVFAMMYFLYYFFGYMGVTGIGGADAKALIAIAVLFPYYPQINVQGIAFPITDVSRSLVFGLAVFGNALALNLIVPVTILLYNLLNVPFGELAANPLGAFTGYKARIEGLKGKHVRLMHHYIEEDGSLKIKRTFGGKDVDGDTREGLARLRAEGKIGDRVWVTPKIPFLIPITIGLIVAVVWGDILTQTISLLLVH